MKEFSINELVKYWALIRINPAGGYHSENCLRQTFVAEQVEIELIDRVVQRFENTQIAKTQDRSTLGCLNDVIRYLKWLSDREQDAP